MHFQEVCAKLNVTEYGDHVEPDFVHYGRPEVNSCVLRRDCHVNSLYVRREKI